MDISKNRVRFSTKIILVMLVLASCVGFGAERSAGNGVDTYNSWRDEIDQEQLETQVTEPKATDRGRVQIDPKSMTLVADNGCKLRGEHLRIANLPWDVDNQYQTHLDRAYDLQVWQEMVETFHLNTVRLLLYRPPQNWGGGPGNNCPADRCFPTVQDAIPHIDAMVEIASEMGMYVIIDYHPVGGYNRDDAITWWNALAPRYKDRTHVIYELSNEPVRWNAAAYKQQDIQFEKDLYQLIRGHAPNTHIILWSFAEASGTGTSMLTKVKSAPEISYENASVGYHPYGNYNPSEMNNLRKAGYPIMDTEIGGSSRESYLIRTTNEENLGVSWIWLDGTGFNKNWSEPLPVTWPRDPRAGKATAATPSVSMQKDPGGDGIIVTIRSSTLGAKIYYTTDGTPPTATNGRLYQGPFRLSANQTILARAYKEGYAASSTSSARSSMSSTIPDASMSVWLPFVQLKRPVQASCN